MRHRGEHVGHFFVGDKADGAAFTPEDEEIVVLFVWQAAATTARTHREVERAWNDLAALVETSPVGVVVFEADCGPVASVIREAHRIVEEIRTAGSPPGQPLGVLTCRRWDGNEVSRAVRPLARLIKGASPTRAEEVELSVPDSRSARALINVMPIHSGDADVFSLLMTMQDLAPFEGLEK